MLQRIAAWSDKGRLLRLFASRKFVTGAEVQANPEHSKYFEDRLQRWTLGWLELRQQ